MYLAIDSLLTFSFSLLSSEATGYNDLGGCLAQVPIGCLNFPPLSESLLSFQSLHFAAFLKSLLLLTARAGFTPPGVKSWVLPQLWRNQSLLSQIEVGAAGPLRDAFCQSQGDYLTLGSTPQVRIAKYHFVRSNHLKLALDPTKATILYGST